MTISQTSHAVLLAALLSLSTLTHASAQSADVAAAIEAWENDDYSRLSDIDRCADAGVPACEAAKGVGQIYGYGWDVNVSAGSKLIKNAAKNGALYAQSSLGDLYTEDDVFNENLPKAAYWHAKAANNPVGDDFAREWSQEEFWRLPFDIIRETDGWMTVPPANPRKRKWGGMGYSLDDKADPMTVEESADFSRAQRAVAQGQPSEYDLYIIARLTAKDKPDAMFLYGSLVSQGRYFPQNPDLASTYLSAAKTWGLE